MVIINHSLTMITSCSEVVSLNYVATSITIMLSEQLPCNLVYDLGMCTIGKKSMASITCTFLQLSVPLWIHYITTISPLFWN
jgi:hypothetical protein